MKKKKEKSIYMAFFVKESVARRLNKIINRGMRSVSWHLREALARYMEECERGR